MKLKFVHIFLLSIKLALSEPEQPNRWTPINNSYEYYSTFSYLGIPHQHTAFMEFFYQVFIIFKHAPIVKSFAFSMLKLFWLATIDWEVGEESHERSHTRNLCYGIMGLSI